MTYLKLNISPTPELPESVINAAIDDASAKGISTEKWVENAFSAYLDRPDRQKPVKAKRTRRAAK